MFFDEASFLNEPYNSKSLYKQGVKHKNERNSFKFKSNAIGSLTINGNSTITITNSSTAPEVAIALIELRKANLKEIKNKISLNNALRNINQPEEEIERILIETCEDPKSFSKKINNAMEKYAEDTIILARIIGKHCKRESTDNIKRKREIRRNLTLEYLKKENIESKMKCEERICLILDNYSVHKSAFIKKIAEILNIELIYLPPYSPHLNPIEQLWRKMKRIIRNEYLESKEFLEELTEKTFFNCLIEHNFYDSWFNLFIIKVW